MDFNIPPVGGVERTGPAAPQRVRAANADFSAGARRRREREHASGIAAAVACSRTCTWPRAWPTSCARRRASCISRRPGTGRVVVQVRDLDGNVIRTIPPAKALEVAAGSTARHDG